MGEGSPRGRGVSALILSRGLYRRGAVSWSDGDAGAVGRTVGVCGEVVTEVGRWQLGHLGRPGAREWAEAQGVFLLSFWFSFSFSVFAFIYFLFCFKSL